MLLSDRTRSSDDLELLAERGLRERPHRIVQFWNRYKKNRAAVVGLIIVCFFILVSVFAPRIVSNAPFSLVANRFIPPSDEYPMGTDDLGRDVFSGVVYGSRVSLLVGFMAAATSTFIGTLIGAFSGYHGGRIDSMLMRITEVFQVVPRFFMALILVALFGASVWNVIFVIGILSWPVTARLVRAEYLSLKEREFIEAATALGMGHLRIVFSEILPNALPPIIVNSSLQVGSGILVEAGLSFLGLGDPSMISWGYMLNNAQRFLRQAWWMASFPGMAIFLTVLGLNLVGDGLNDALNPKLKER
jgi:peptide/nickel transport system permease protein